MFARVKKGRKAEYLQIVENYRDGGKVRQRLILYVGPYDSIQDALERMPQHVKDANAEATRMETHPWSSVREVEAPRYRAAANSVAARLERLRELAQEHPEMLEREQARLERHRERKRIQVEQAAAERETRRKQAADRREANRSKKAYFDRAVELIEERRSGDQQRDLREKVGEPEPEVEMLRKRRNRLRAASRRRFRRVDDVQVAAHLQGITLADDDWRKVEEILQEAERLSEEADKLNAELKRRR